MTPTARFLFSHPAHFIACGLGSGLSPLAPGTAGTLLGWAVYPVLRPSFGDLEFLGFLAAAFLVGIFACQRTGRDLEVADHRSIVWDEIVPFWLVLALAPESWEWQLAAFVLFRGFDIVKPPPADWVDEHLKNGLGVMLDDLCAAGYTLLVLAVTRRILG